jgi:A/G-specific adenine glycosylase
VGGLNDPHAVLRWGTPRLRDLPWRHERDPWRILVAEVMLQQTQAERVIPKWRAFLAAFPDPAACAAAPLGAVLQHWQGLGYPRRAKHLHDTATRVTVDLDGRLPDDVDALRALPGIGPYTARAVLAFAFERDVGVVDTNIARVLARSTGSRLTPSAAQRLADAAVPVGQGWLWNQVLMDLGATRCRPAPRCTDCPVAPGCAWHGAGHPQPDPAVGSAGVSVRQAPYAGSRRQARGDVLRELHAGPLPVAGFDAEIVAGLVADGLVTTDGTTVTLPE